MPIHKKAGRSRQSEALGFVKILLHRSSLFPAVQAGIEAIPIQLQYAGVFLQGVDICQPAVKKYVVIFPEFALLPGTARSLRGLFGAVVHGQRKILEDNRQIISILFLKLLDLGIDLLAIGALVVGELHENHWAILRAVCISLSDI